MFKIKNTNYLNALILYILVFEFLPIPVRGIALDTFDPIIEIIKNK